VTGARKGDPRRADPASAGTPTPGDRSGSGLAVVGAVPPEADGNGPRAAAALLAALAARGVPAWPVVLADDDAVADAIARADAVVLIDPRPVHAELARVARLAGARRLVLAPQAYAFCEIASRTCDRCPLAKTCRASDRVAVYRALAARADLIVYASDLHRAASEDYLGAHPAKTCVMPPPGVPVLAGGPPAPTADAIAFAGGDPVEWSNLTAWATAHPDRALAIHGPPPPGIAIPANVQLRPPIGTRTQLDLLAAARTLVVLPGHPLPFGIAAAAAYRAGVEVVTNDQVGLAAHAVTPAAFDRALAAADAALAGAVVELARTPPPAPIAATPLGRVLLHVHHVGLGDSINLSALARTLIDAGAAVTYAVPAAHHPLLADQLPGGAVAIASELDLASARGAHDTIVEVTIKPSDAFAGDIVEDRWLQLALDRQPSGMTPMHEQFLALFARAGHALVPRRPEIALTAGELAAGRALYRDAGIDLARELVVAIHPGAGNPGKRWAAARFAALIGRLRERGARIAVVGGATEGELAAEIAAAAPGIDLVRCGTPLRDVGAVLAAATLVVANDSGLMHLASAVGTPTLGIFGPTSERLWGPTHRYAAGVRARGAEPTKALAALAPEDVERAFVGLARRVAGEPPLAPSTRITASPRATRIATGDGIEWRGRAVVTIHGPDPIAPIVEACRAEPAWASLAADHDPDLLAALLAAEVIVPVWSVRALGSGP
jgi:hypothetical protein